MNLSMQKLYTPIRERVVARETLSGTFVNLGSATAAEIVAQSGFDWMLIDLEHGYGDHESLVSQLQAVSRTDCSPIVRIAWNDPVRVKRVLDMGAAGIMFPFVNTAAEAEIAAKSMRYPPLGIRGVSRLSRASEYGADFVNYYENAHKTLTTVVQIETQEALDNAHEIASVEGVDALFLGPMDLSVNLGIKEQYDHPTFQAARKRVADAAKQAGKAAGILLLLNGSVEDCIEEGYTLIAMGSDSGCLIGGMKNTAQQINALK